MKHIDLGGLSCSHLISGRNPFSGNFHQTPEMGKEILRYFTISRIKDIFREDEELGIDTFIGRADRHITRTFLEYWDVRLARHFGGDRYGVKFDVCAVRCDLGLALLLRRTTSHTLNHAALW